jgi:hypothetical protein
MKASVPTPDNGAGRSTANGRIFGLKKSTLSLITALAVGTPLLVACDSADAIPVNTEVTSTPAATTTEQTPAPTTTSKAPVVESTTSKAPKPEVTSTTKAPKPEVTSSKETTTSAQPAPSTTSAKPAEPTEETTSAAPTTTSKAPKPAPTTEEVPNEPTESTPVTEPVEEVPAKYRGAVKKAESYLSRGGISYSLIFKEMTEEDGFTEEQAAFALEHANVDWEAEALLAAQREIDGDNGRSKASLFSWLTSTMDMGVFIGIGGFTDDEAFYAVNNVDVDWNEEAVEKVDASLKTFSPISREMLYFMLSPSFTSQGFTRPQLDYAFAQLPENTWKEQAVREARVYTLNNDPSRAELINFLVNGEKYTRDEAEYAADKVGL